MNTAARVDATHRIRIDLPVAQAQRLFTPAGEELWVEHWAPHYLHPADGRTEAGMVFTTGSGDDYTVWSLADYDTTAFRARYTRVTPATRTGFVEVQCRPAGDAATDVEVSYRLTALNDAGARSLEAYRGAAFVAMIEGWKALIDAQLPRLRNAVIR